MTNSRLCIATKTSSSSVPFGTPRPTPLDGDTESPEACRTSSVLDLPKEINFREFSVDVITVVLL